MSIRDVLDQYQRSRRSIYAGPELTATERDTAFALMSADSTRRRARQYIARLDKDIERLLDARDQHEQNEKVAASRYAELLPEVRAIEERIGRPVLIGDWPEGGK